MRYQKLCEYHQVHIVDLYICSGIGSNGTGTHDSLRQYPHMQSRDDVVICMHMSPYGYTIAHAHPVLGTTWKVESLCSSNILPCRLSATMDLAVVLMARKGPGLGPKLYITLAPRFRRDSKRMHFETIINCFLLVKCSWFLWT